MNEHLPLNYGYSAAVESLQIYGALPGDEGFNFSVWNAKTRGGFGRELLSILTLMCLSEDRWVTIQKESSFPFKSEAEVPLALQRTITNFAPDIFQLLEMNEWMD